MLSAVFAAFALIDEVVAGHWKLVDERCAIGIVPGEAPATRRASAITRSDLFNEHRG